VSRRSKGPTLYLKTRPGYTDYWYIRDGAKRIATGCTADENNRAQLALARYIYEKQALTQGDGYPHHVSIADVIALYAKDRAPETSRPKATIQRLSALLGFFGAHMVTYVTPTNCKTYVKQRGSEPAARRELEDLQAALTYAWRNRVLNQQVPVTLPSKVAPRERWLTKREARRLIRAAAKHAPHLLRFILIGLYTGSRSSAILGLGWRAHPEGGHVDLEHRLLYRRPLNTRDTANKRRPPCRIDPVLLKRLRRWQPAKIGRDAHIIQFEGAGVKSIKHSWATVRKAAGLSGDVTPHVLRHTCVTWRLQRGDGIWDTAHHVGMGVQILTQVYGHHTPANGETENAHQ
jgi:integrase